MDAALAPGGICLFMMTIDQRDDYARQLNERHRKPLLA
jgi:hypothetical protein